MTASLRSAITLTVLGLLLVAGVAWGWTAVTEPFPEAAEAPICVDRTAIQGEEVDVSQVTVSVLNASNQEGLAGRTMQAFEDAGFATGTTGNAPEGTTLEGFAIWSAEPRSPAVQLVRSKISGEQVTPPPAGAEALGVGVVVVVGADFEALREGRTTILAKQDSVFCSPTAS